MSTYSQKIGSWIIDKTNSSLVDLCRRFGYPERETKIMSLDETDERKSKPIIKKDAGLVKLYIGCSKSSKAIARKGDNRSWTQYFKDLITGWILEDLSIEQFRSWGLDVKHHGKDAQRIIQIDGNVSQDADLKISVGDVSRDVELTNEFNPILSNEGFIEKRAPALFNLWKAKGIWIFRDVPRGKYVLVDFATERITLHLRNHNTASNWSKDVHRYVLSENEKKERDERMLAAEIISVVGCSIKEDNQPELQEIEDTDSPPKVFTKGGKLRRNAVQEPTPKEDENSIEPKENAKCSKSTQSLSGAQDAQKIIDRGKQIKEIQNYDDTENYNGENLGDDEFI